MMLLDSCIIIDITRRNVSALEFLRKLNAPPALSVLSITEVESGILRKEEDKAFSSVIASSAVFNVNVEISSLAAKFLRKYRRSHGMDIVDALIAATAQIHNLEFATLNLKHFPMFPDMKRPY